VKRECRFCVCTRIDLLAIAERWCFDDSLRQTKIENGEYRRRDETPSPSSRIAAAQTEIAEPESARADSAKIQRDLRPAEFRCYYR